MLKDKTLEKLKNFLNEREYCLDRLETEFKICSTIADFCIEREPNQYFFGDRRKHDSVDQFFAHAQRSLYEMMAVRFIAIIGDIRDNKELKEWRGAKLSKDNKSILIEIRDRYSHIRHCYICHLGQPKKPVSIMANAL